MPYMSGMGFPYMSTDEAALRSLRLYSMGIRGDEEPTLSSFHPVFAEPSLVIQCHHTTSAISGLCRGSAHYSSRGHVSTTWLFIVLWTSNIVFISLLYSSSALNNKLCLLHYDVVCHRHVRSWSDSRCVF